MTKNKKSPVTNYTDKDLESFAMLENFSNYNVDLIEIDNNHKLAQQVGYTASDNKQFKKFMNFNKNTKISSKKDFINDFKDSDELTDKRKSKRDDSFYNESDLQNFKNLKKFPFNINPETLKYTNKKDDPVVTKINYTDNDLEAFDRIVESKEHSANNQTKTKNTDKKNLQSNIDRSSIKIIDFDELKKREAIRNKKRIKKIKVKYFD